MAYIERKYLIEQFENLLHNDNVMNPVMKVLDALEILDTAPTADVEEVRHGIWTFARRGRKVVCSCCETPAPFKKNETYHTLWNSKYCPNCGADMRGEK